MHFSLGVILKKEKLKKRKDELKKECINLTDAELNFKSIKLETLNSLNPFIESGLIYNDSCEETYLDYYTIGGRWSGCLPIKQSVQNKRKSELLYEFDKYCNNTMSYSKIKDINFITLLEDFDIAKYKEEYKNIINEAKKINNKFILEEYPTFEDYKKDKEIFDTNSFLTSNGEWFELYDYNINDTKERREKAKELFLSLLEKEDKDDIFVLVDCHI